MHQDGLVAKLGFRFDMLLVLLLTAVATAPSAFGGSPSPEDDSPTFKTPPAPIRTPQAEMETMELVEGYRLELVASEPLIQDPIAITFGPDGRLWVCEMRGFMPDIEGTNEDAAVGVISVLEDTDRDGVMDKSTVFLDGLVLPRGLCWTLNGILVCENGTIWECVDIDGDDRCDNKRVVCNYNRGNLEHSLNGLMPALDNRIYNAKEGIRLRRTAGQWVREPYGARGQWGITQDDAGRLRYNVNASLLRGDLVPCYSSIAASNNSLTDMQLYDEQTMYPIRPTPGINRGYIPGFLRADGSLIEANSNCGPVVFRGDNLPAELLGDVFIPEPAGNLIRRQVIVKAEGRTTSRNAYDRREFLASTDERFRPVNMFNSPDGTLYIVDMYRGVIQHGAYITPYLRDQILSRQLDKGIHLGRIYRLAHESTKPRDVTDLSELPNDELVGYLSHANGWHRDMAQQLLVQRGDVSFIRLIENVAADGLDPKGRLHAVWTLAGLNRIDPELLYELLSDEDTHVRASAVTLYQRFLRMESMVDSVVADLSELADDEEELVRLQVSQGLGLIDSERADRALDPILKSASMDAEVLDGLLGGFSKQQVEFLANRLRRRSWDQHEPWRERLLNASAKVLWRQRSPIEVLRLCHLLNYPPRESLLATDRLTGGNRGNRSASPAATLCAAINHQLSDRDDRLCGRWTTGRRNFDP